MKSFVVIAIWILSMSFHGCQQGSGDLAGTGTKVGNAYVSGIVVNLQGTHDIAKIYLRSVDFISNQTPGYTESIGHEFQTCSDSTGSYSFNGIPEGEYLLEARSGDTLGVLRNNIKIGVDDMERVLGCDTLRKTGTLTGTLALPEADSGCSFVVVLPGFATNVCPDNDGNFQINNLSSGSYSLQINNVSNRQNVWDTIGVRIGSDSISFISILSLSAYWKVLDYSGLSGSAVSSLTMCMWNNFKVVAYSNQSADQNIEVKIFKDTIWDTFGGSSLQFRAFGTEPKLVSGNNQLFLGFIKDANSQLVFHKWDSGAWKPFGETAISCLPYSKYSATVCSTELFVSFSDSVVGGRLSVVRTQGEKWLICGQRGLSKGKVKNHALVVLNDVPLVVFSDSDSADKMNVLMFTGVDWKDISPVNVKINSKSVLSSVIWQGKLIVGYSDSYCGERASAIAWNGLNWETLGLTGFTIIPINEIKLGTDGNSIYAGIIQDSPISQIKVFALANKGWNQLSVNRLPWSPILSLEIIVENNIPSISVIESMFANKISALEFVPVNQLP
ncbi:MAG: hypothetical protein JNL74_14370 [Fibrobacteres bacterium]|nr:hypothetical protein [Fibrobacterota bacterium]